MKTIRQSVFETNSSASHSITICINGEYDYDGVKDNSITYSTILPDKNGIIKLTGGYFDEFEITDSLTKANFCAVCVVDDPSCKEDYDLLVSVIKEHTGAKEVVFDVSFEKFVNNERNKKYSHICYDPYDAW